ncbi:hypothetical protein ACYULU_05855 [Breznakiellaceae bacterium SP9]
MPNNRKAIIIIIMLLSASLYAHDYGFILRQAPVLTDGGGSKDSTFAYTGTAIPWFAAPVGEKADIYLSGGISAELENEEWKPVLDVYRFEFTYTPHTHDL